MGKELPKTAFRIKGEVLATSFKLGEAQLAIFR